jgi:hypothetical protein
VEEGIAQLAFHEELLKARGVGTNACIVEAKQASERQASN